MEKRPSVASVTQSRFCSASSQQNHGMRQFVRTIASSFPRSGGSAPVLSGQRGVSLLELMLVVGLVALLSAIAIPSYQRYVDRAKSSRGVQDIGQIQMEIERFRTRQGRLPASLAEAAAAENDPWGAAYVYLDYAADADQSTRRRDGNLRPINTDYDLYSKGKDGQTNKSLSHAKSADDIVRALDGSFIGSAKDF